MNFKKMMTEKLFLLQLLTPDHFGDEQKRHYYLKTENI